MLLGPQDNRGSWHDYEFVNFKIVSHEIFLFLISIGIKHNSYKYIEQLLYSTFFPKDRYNSKKEARNFDFIYGHTDIIKPYYNEIKSKNFYSPMANLIITRVPDFMTKKQVVEADLLCCYVAELNGFWWFPITYVYDTSRDFELFYKMESKHHFEKVKVLFNVETVEELKIALKKLEDNENKIHRFSYPGAQSVIPIYKLIDIEKVCTKR